MMLYISDSYRIFTSFRMTRIRFAVILSGAKDIYKSNTINIRILLLGYIPVIHYSFPIPNSQLT